MGRESVLAAVVLALLTAFGARGQEYSDTTSVVVVEVPVHVTRGGEPVPDLTAENFELLDEGTKQTISGFDVVDLGQPMSAADARMLGASARRHFIFVFDLTFSEPGVVVRARQAARDVVRRSLHPTDLVAVATYSNRTGPQIVLNFTTDRRQVEEAFGTLGLIRQQRRIDDPLGIVVRSPAIADDLATDDEPSESGREGIDVDEEVRLAIENLVGESSRADVRRRVNIFTGTFGFLAEMLAPLDGRKHVVFLSQGFDASALFGTMDQERIAEIQDAVEQGEIWNVDSQERFGDSQALSGLTDLLDEFKRADATIHSIDIGRMAVGEPAAAARGRRDGLFMLSSETGGEFYRNYNDLSQAMGEMLERTSVTYVLAFQPTDLRRGDLDFRRLRVRAKDVPRGTRVVHRQGYFPPRSFGELSEAQQRMQTAQQLATGIAPGSLSLDVLAMPFSTGGEQAYVPLLVQIPGRELVSSNKGELPLELYAYATDESGELKDYFGESLTFDLAQVGASLATTGLRFYGHLDLAPGAYAVRVMAKDKRTGSTAAQVVPLEVPDFGKVHLAVMPPLVPEGVDRWVSVRESSERAALRSVDYPFMFKTQPFVPAIRPLFQPEQVVAVSLAASTSGAGPLEVSSLILAEDGTPLPGTFLRVLERESASGVDLESLIAAFEVPNLPGGNYSLVVTMSDPGTGEVDSGSLEFSLGERSAAGVFAAPRWMPDLSEIVSQLGPADSETKIVKIDKQSVAAEYKEVLRLLAAGRQMSAVLALADLEAGVVNKDNPMSTLNQMAKVQGDVLGRVTRRDPELLLPAILLHKETYSQYRIRKESFLSVHARSSTLRLIDEYVKRARTAEARTLASDILTGMVSEVYESGAHISAMSMLLRAIELDEENAVALTGLGFLLETTGREDRIPTYEDAVEMFERAIRVAPDLYEARLRLGVNLRRLDRGLEAGRQLNTLIEAGDAPDWIRSLAFQELARLYLQGGQCDQARRVLERGRQQLPDESKLALQLSYAYERCQRQAQAKRAIRAAEGGGSAARYLYLQVPQAVMSFSGGPWTERAESRLPALEAALGPVQSGVGG